MRTTATLGAMLVSAFALAGCGTSSSRSQTQAQTARPSTAASNADVGQAKIQVASISGTKGSSLPRTGATSSGGRVSHGSPVHPKITTTSGTSTQPARQPSGGKPDNVRPAVPKGLNPCTLVSRAQAQAIVGSPLTGTVEAPLGPTCIYMLGSGQPNVTMAIELQALRQLKHHMRHRTQIQLGGRRAYCGQLGTQMLFVPLGPGKVLNVTAPCAVAQRFASVALAHLAA